MRREEDEGGGEGEDMAESRVGEEMISRCVCVCVGWLVGWLASTHQCPFTLMEKAKCEQVRGASLSLPNPVA